MRPRLATAAHASLPPRLLAGAAGSITRKARSFRCRDFSGTKHSRAPDHVLEVMVQEKLSGSQPWVFFGEVTMGAFLPTTTPQKTSPNPPRRCTPTETGRGAHRGLSFLEYFESTFKKSSTFYPRILRKARQTGACRRTPGPARGVSLHPAPWTPNPEPQPPNPRQR